MTDNATSAQPEDLDVTVPAEAVRLRELRRVVSQFARLHGADRDASANVVLAVHEACSNVVRHAYGEEGGPLHLKAGCESGVLQFVVSDNGKPVADPDARPGAGLGLHLVRNLCDDFDIEGPGEYGTRVRMSFRLSGSATAAIPDFVK
jgi:anti-sigma regulatory factor (Ser/Thr protein kinase)